MEVLVVRKLVTGMRAEGWPARRGGKGGGGGAIVGNESKNFASWWGGGKWAEKAIPISTFIVASIL